MAKKGKLLTEKQLNELKEIARQYKHKSDFKKGAPDAYRTGRRHGVLKEVCHHMTPKGNLYNRGIYIIINERLSQVYIGLTCHFERRHREHLSGVQPSTRDLVGEADTEFKPLTDYLPVKEAKAKEREIWSSYLLTDYLVVNRMVPGGLGAGIRKWTDERLAEEAKKYPTRGAFCEGSPQAYGAAHKRGILDEICAHMVPLRENWSIEELKQLARLCSTRGEFRSRYKNAYSAAVKKGLLDEVCAHMPVRERCESPEKAIVIAARYKTASEFAQGSPSAYRRVLNWGIRDVAMAHMQCQRGSERKYSDEEIVAIGKSYEDFVEFKTDRKDVYQAAVRHGLVQQTTGHMLNKVPRYTDEELFEIGERFDTRAEFMKEAGGAYQASRRKGIIDQVCAHMAPGQKGHRKWLLEDLKVLAGPIETESEFRRMHFRAFLAAKKAGWLDEVCSHMERIFWWDKPKVMAKAKEFSLRRDFLNGAPGAYAYADRHGFLEEACAHMKPVTRYDYESAKAAAAASSSRTEFLAKHRGAYNWAKNNGCFDEICAHIPDRRKLRKK